MPHNRKENACLKRYAIFANVYLAHDISELAYNHHKQAGHVCGDDFTDIFTAVPRSIELMIYE